jgi:hypothetical protein
MVFHGSNRCSAIATTTVALPLGAMFNRRDGSVRFSSNESLCANYRLASGSRIVLSGTDHDAPLERWWGFGASKRREIIRKLKLIGISLTTTPNYSLFIDGPRWDDLHSMKRIALVHYEFQSEGLVAALHVNGRTESDFRRWAEYVVRRTEITHLAYEFTTGTGWAGRQNLHATWLCEIAAAVGRPLSLLQRGGIEILPKLARSFDHVTFLDTTSFMKTIKRQRAYLNGRMDWLPSPTDEDAPLDDLFAHNVSTYQAWIGNVAASHTTE